MLKNDKRIMISIFFFFFAMCTTSQDMTVKIVSTSSILTTIIIRGRVQSIFICLILQTNEAIEISETWYS